MDNETMISTSVREVTEQEKNLTDKVTELQERIDNLQPQLTAAHRFAEHLGTRLRELAGEYDWCERYDKEIEAISDGWGHAGSVAQTFVEAAKRSNLVEKTFEGEIEIEMTSDDYTFEMSYTESFAEHGVYMVPSDFEPDEIGDLEEYEHVGGTDLVAWLRQANHLGADVCVAENGISEK